MPLFAGKETCKYDFRTGISKNPGCMNLERRIKVKRETGESPVRTRHCKQGEDNHVRRTVTDAKNCNQHALGRRLELMICKPGNLPFIGTGMEFQITSN